MRFSLRSRKSAGIAVTTAVHRLIHQGNAARDGQDWAGAATAYQAALDDAPSLRHIWLQLGHMLKEADLPEKAARSYERAFAIDASDPEPLVHIAHLFKKTGDLRASAQYFIRAIRVGGGHAESLSELGVAVRRIFPIDPPALHEAARHDDRKEGGGLPAAPVTPARAIEHLLAEGDDVGEREAEVLRSAGAVLARIETERAVTAAGEAPGIVFDVTDLIAHFRHQRLPTGIQRVQIEVVAHALHDPGLDVRICCFADGRDGFLDVPRGLFMELAGTSTLGGSNQDRDWSILMGRLAIHLLTTDGFSFERGDRLVNLGTSWWVHNYFLLIRNAKREFGILYIPFVHDLIPIMAADHCVSGVIEEYISWLIGAIDHADLFLTNSRSTARDLIEAAGRLGHRLDPASIEIVTLDADFRQASAHDLPPGELARWCLDDTEYCLFVSTIESRKNHILALEAWSRLIAEHGVDAVPMLVCVGRNGWLNAAFFERLHRDQRLRARVIVIERVSDDQLALLYRRCLFTLYPSHYEGWGLPVTESLCYGRVPVVADNSSLTEAGGAFAVFFESNSISGLVEALGRVLFEPRYREELEQAIATRFRPRRWSSIADQIVRAVAATTSADAGGNVPEAAPGRYYPIGLRRGLRIWRGLGSGELFRIGEGWLWPEPHASRTMPTGGTLLLRIVETLKPLRLYMRLRGLDGAESGFVISVGSHVVSRGSLNAGEERWVVGDIPPVEPNGLLEMRVRGASYEEVTMTTGATAKQIEASIGVVGFAVVERGDEAARLAFVERATLIGLRDLSAYAEPHDRVGTTIRDVATA
jgi:glycosyltransferase involved in cell wall biosynthesis